MGLFDPPPLPIRIIMKKITDRQRSIRDKHHGVLALYKSAQYTTEQIAKNYSITTREVQRIAKKYGIIRTLAEANRVAAPLKHYHSVPLELRVKRKQISQKQRYIAISSHPFCTMCGMKPSDGIRLEVDHIDENPSNNEPINLQVLCGSCNAGKSHVARFTSS